MTLSGPPHVTSTWRSSSARCAIEGSVEGLSATSTPASLKAPVAEALGLPYTPVDKLAA